MRSIACWLLAAASAALAAEPINLLTNPGFEDGVKGWTFDEKQTRITDPQQAHSGAACVTGEIEGPKQALSLTREIKVRAGNRYRFECWARATNGTRMVLWVTLPGRRRRQSVQAWDGVPARWKRFSAAVSVPRSGTLTLELVGPSSWSDQPAGRLWVDDLALYETPMPGLLAVSKGQGFNDDPALARATDGSLYAAWLSFRPLAPREGKRRTVCDGADSLQVARYVPDGQKLAESGAWQVVGGKGTYLLGIRAVAAGEQVTVVYAAEVDGNWDVYAVACGPDGPGRPAAVGASPGVDV
ncbi:MAG: carbohydrate binding domain-containing protein, partial [Planctomycetota bacterium]